MGPALERGPRGAAGRVLSPAHDARCRDHPPARRRRVGDATLTKTLVISTLTATLSHAGIPDAPVEGFGSGTPGGSGGTSYVVTTLDNSGPGSLRDALSEPNRMITFAVSGDLDVSSPLRPHSFTTIDGSTAPEPGITLIPHETYDGVLVEIDGDAFGEGNTHDIVFRHLRLRGGLIDNIRMLQGAHHIVIDHCSSTGAEDGNIDISQDCHDITIQWCILGANLRNSLIHTDVSNLSLHHNLYVLGGERNPQAHTRCGVIDIVNNYVYGWDPTPDDWGGDPGYGVRIRWDSTANLIKNAFVPGPESDPALAVVIDDASVYSEGNEIPPESDDAGTAAERFDAPPVTELDVATAKMRVLEEAGAFPRDAFDAALVQAVRDGTVPVGDPDPGPPGAPPVDAPRLRVASRSPADAVVTLGYRLPAPGAIAVDVFDVAGRLASSVPQHPVVRDGALALDVVGLAPGAYTARLRWLPTGGGPPLDARTRFVILK